MYAKIFNRIVESSLMEEPIEVRYTFVFLLAIADPEGYVIGTDIAIARRLNMPLEDFQKSLEVLKQPDPNSNSSEFEGRRVVDSDVERGYKMVNYITYRDQKDAENRREYMRNYMRRRRLAGMEGDDVNLVNSELARLTQEEEAVKEEEMAKFDSPEFNKAWKEWQKHLKQKKKKPTEVAISKQLEKCFEMGVERAIKMLNHSTTNGYTGLFEPNESRHLVKGYDESKPCI